MAQRYNPATGEWEDDGTDTGAGPYFPLQGPNAPGTDLVSGGRTKVDSPAQPTIQDAPAAFDRSQGGVAQTNPNTSPVVGADLQTRQAGAGVTFYNGNTGASATYDPTTGMYIDANGQSIRPDAIRTSDPAAYSGQPAASAAAPVAPAVAPVAPAVAAANPFNDAIRKIIMDELAKAQSPVDPNSPEIAATMSASSDAGQRASDAERTALAERLYAQGGGLNTDALTREVQQSGEKQAANQSNLKAQLLTNQYNQKRQQLDSLLSMAVQSGDAESARAVQLQIANLQVAAQRYGIDTSASVARSAQGINLAEFGANLNQEAALAGLRG